MIREKICPKKVLKRLEDLDLGYFKDKKVKVLLIDLDNTLGAHDQKIIDEKMTNILKTFKENGFKVIVFSNNTTKRVKLFLNDLDFDYFSFAMKPLPFSYLKIIKKLKIEKQEAVAIGDQIFTDVLGANLVGIYSIFVEPLYKNKDGFSTKIIRKLEKYVRKKYKI